MTANRFHDLLALDMSLDEACAFKVPDGPHRGLTIAEVGASAEGLEWLRGRFREHICPIGYKAALFVYLEARLRGEDGKDG